MRSLILIHLKWSDKGDTSLCGKSLLRLKDHCGKDGERFRCEGCSSEADQRVIYDEVFEHMEIF